MRDKPPRHAPRVFYVVRTKTGEIHHPPTTRRKEAVDLLEHCDQKYHMSAPHEIVELIERK